MMQTCPASIVGKALLSQASNGDSYRESSRNVPDRLRPWHWPQCKALSFSLEQVNNERNVTIILNQSELNGLHLFLKEGLHACTEKKWTTLVNQLMVTPPPTPCLNPACAFSQQLANHSLWAKSSLPPTFIKFYWNMTMLIYVLSMIVFTLQRQMWVVVTDCIA